MRLNHVLVFRRAKNSYRKIVTECESFGRFPFDQKYRDFRSETEWNGKNSGKSFRKFRNTFWVHPLFRKIGITGKFRSIRPFLLRTSFSEPGNRIQHGWYAQVLNIILVLYLTNDWNILVGHHCSGYASTSFSEYCENTCELREMWA